MIRFEIPMEGIQDIIRWDAVRTDCSLSEKPTRCASQAQGIQPKPLDSLQEVDAGRRREEDKEKEGFLDFLDSILSWTRP